mgnify:CR=1 FL=1
MLLPKTNIERELSSLQKEQLPPEKLLKEVYAILEGETPESKVTVTTISKSKPAIGNAFHLDLLETDKIYHINQIQKICIDYRLRFLDSKYFKGKIPQAALDKIQQLEAAHEITIACYKVMAPSKLFKLEDKDDPLLFAPIGNGYYYLIHKWGNDLHPLRKALVWPFKNIVNLTITTLIISYLATLLVPDGLFTKGASTTEFWVIYFFMFKSIAAVVIFYGFALGKNFNPVIWNSKYFNA